jgi:hypothetical protein
MAQRASLLTGPFMQARFHDAEATGSSLERAYAYRGANHRGLAEAADGAARLRSSAIRKDRSHTPALPRNRNRGGQFMVQLHRTGESLVPNSSGDKRLEASLRIQHQIDGAITAVCKQRCCSARRHDTHARLRVGAVGASLRGAAGFLSSATLRRSASMRLITRRGAANAGLRSGMAPACLALRCANSASS